MDSARDEDDLFIFGVLDIFKVSADDDWNFDASETFAHFGYRNVLYIFLFYWSFQNG